MSEDVNLYVSKEQALLIAQEAGKAAAKELLTTLGVDTSSPEAIIRQQVDFAHLRRARRSSESIRQHSFKVVIATALVGALSFMWVTLSKSGG